MKRLLACLLLPNLSNASALTDYQCVNDCTAKGHQYSFCTSKCSTDDAQNPTTPQNPDPWNDRQQKSKQVDFQCMNQCTAAGYQYQLYHDKCSY